MREWKVADLEGLNGEAEQARERLIRYIERVGKVGRRIASRREERLAAAAERMPVGV